MKSAVFNFRMYFSHLAQNLFVKPDTRKRSYLTNSVWSIIMLTVFPLYALTTWIFMRLDAVMFPGYKKQVVEKPVFILGSFRSGTTFLQRMMGKDTKHFSSATSWELMVAPSVCQRKLVRGIFYVDNVFGKPLRRFVLWAENALLHEKSAHKMGLRHHEEDEAFFIHIYASAFVFFANPYGDTRDYFFYDKLIPHHRRKKEMSFYNSCVKRHMHTHPESQYYLSKSPTFSCRMESLMERFPDCRIIFMARHPLDVLPSLLHWFTQVWNGIEKDGIRFPYKDFVIDFVRHWYVDGLDVLKALPQDQIRVVRYDDLIADPYHTLESIYEWLDLEMTTDFKEIMSHEKAKAKKTWKPKVHNLQLDGIQPQAIEKVFAPVFRRFGFSIEEYSNM